MNLGYKAIPCIVFIFVVFLPLEIISKENSFKRKCQHMNDVPFSAGAESHSPWQAPGQRTVLTSSHQGSVWPWASGIHLWYPLHELSDN